MIMKLTHNTIITKIHLLISVVIVVPASFIYGFELGDFLDLNPNSVDEFNFFKSVMGLYLGFSTIWILGVLKANYLKLALVSNVVFMLGLGIGRAISVIIDGQPSLAYSFGIIGELLIGLYGLWVLTFKSKSIGT